MTNERVNNYVYLKKRFGHLVGLQDYFTAVYTLFNIEFVALK